VSSNQRDLAAACHLFTGWLVVSTPLKDMKVSWDYEIPNIWKNETCSKPPTSWIFDVLFCMFLGHKYGEFYHVFTEKQSGHLKLGR
jgi:hypothetical protein